MGAELLKALVNIVLCLKLLGLTDLKKVKTVAGWPV